MECFGGKSKKNIKIKNKQCEKQLRGLNGKVRILEEEIKEMMCQREKESRNYERDGMVFAFKEAEWKQEKKKLKDEVRRLRKMLEDGKFGEKERTNWSITSSVNSVASSMVVEQMKEERLWRDEAVEKWKKLYLAIKTELDDLLERTHPGDGLYSKAEEEEIIEQLKMEVKCKGTTIEELKAKLAAVEKEEYKRAREVDILRQSLRIMTSKKVPSKPNFAFLKYPQQTLKFTGIN